MEITKEIIQRSKVINEGTTSFVMEFDNRITYKIYKETLEYIGGKKEYSLNEKITATRLNYIVSKKDDVKLTDLPSKVLTYKGKPVGVALEYYNDCTTLEDFFKENNSEENIDSVKKQINAIVAELIEHGIVPTDPHFGNFLVKYNLDGSYVLKMVDTDDQYVSVYPNGKRDVWYESEVNACYRVIDLSFEELNKNRQI